jgi:hypothetical protein
MDQDIRQFYDALFLAKWDEQDWKTFVSLLRRFADDALALPTNGKEARIPALPAIPAAVNHWATRPNYWLLSS